MEVNKKDMIADKLTEEMTFIRAGWKKKIPIRL